MYECIFCVIGPREKPSIGFQGISIGSFSSVDREDEFPMLIDTFETQVLQFVKLHTSPKNIQAKYCVLQRITKFPRKSQACQIDFV